MPYGFPKFYTLLTAAIKGVWKLAEPTWYLVQVKRNAFKLAERNLIRQSFKCFQPLVMVTIRSGTKFRNVAKPLFPGYLFVAFDVEQSNWQKINNTLGVARLLTRDGIPQAIPDQFIEDLEGRLNSTGHLILSNDFEKEDDVSINSGPFVGLLAQVERLEPNQRVSLLIRLMGIETRLTADITKIKKV